MAFDPVERVALGQTGLSVTKLGFGGASIGGLFTAVSDDDARGVVRRAWDIGIRYFDTAPLYGYGASERRIGDELRAEPRETFVLSTKVGRLIRSPAQIQPGDEIDHQTVCACGYVNGEYRLDEEAGRFDGVQVEAAPLA